MQKQEIQFQVEGETLRGTLMFPDVVKEKNPGVMFFHGFSVNQKRFLDPGYPDQLAKIGIVSMTLDLRGHGQSEGNFETLTPREAIQDVLAAYDYFSSLPMIDTSRIGLCESSFGGMLAAMLSAQRNVRSLLLRAPATYTPHMMDTVYAVIKKLERETPLFREIPKPEETSMVRGLSEFAGSILVVASGNDAIIPEAIPTAYYESAKRASAREFIMIPNAQHSMSSSPELMKFFGDILTDWFKKRL